MARLSVIVAAIACVVLALTAVPAKADVSVPCSSSEVECKCTGTDPLSPCSDGPQVCQRSSLAGGCCWYYVTGMIGEQTYHCDGTDPKVAGVSKVCSCSTGPDQTCTNCDTESNECTQCASGFTLDDKGKYCCGEGPTSSSTSTTTTTTGSGGLSAGGTIGIIFIVLICCGGGIAMGAFLIMKQRRNKYSSI